MISFYLRLLNIMYREWDKIIGYLFLVFNINFKCL